ncbi:endo alpha-1,4 polygalactosaminidase [Streptomyces sp. NPDC008001]|uniref:endo alpha-1,4 polygalactosaminidase n=1 Tax=Streptomyces sp. NPDC008001 TaxID=3364804 RepID=UPI0036E15C71
MKRRQRSCAALFALLVLAALAGCSAGEPDDGPDDDHGDRPAPTTSRAPGSGSSGGTGRPGGPHWQPRPGLRWQWQLDGKVDTGAGVPVYDIDGFENSAGTVKELHDRGAKVICYVNAGAWEDFRSDQKAFPKRLLGERNKGWKGEKWLDIRRLDELRPIMAARFDMCREKGFDAVEPDLTEGYRNRTGFPLSGDDQLAFNRMLARLAHDRGMAVGLKNDLDQIPALVGDFDFAVNEQCAEFEECEKLTPFIKGGKAVFHVEYALEPKEFCPTAQRLGLSSMRKKLELDAWREPCG